MSDPKDIDWNEAIEDAQRLDMLRLQREQTDLLRDMSQGGNNFTTPNFLEKKLGVMRSQDPVLYQIRYEEWIENEKRRRVKWSIGVIVLFGLFFLVATIGAAIS